MEDFGAEVGEFGGFVVGDFGDGLGFRDEARVGGFDAVDVGPDDGFGGIERGAEDCGGVVGAAAAERGLDAFGGGCDEAGDDGDDFLVEERFEFGGGAMSSWGP